MKFEIDGDYLVWIIIGLTVYSIIHSIAQAGVLAK